jgi:cobalt-zinc-cadmium resistance protein CzcA
VVVGGMFIGPLLLLVVAPALRKIFLASKTGKDQVEKSELAAKDGQDATDADLKSITE